jgi:hypothetical protein
MFYNFFKVSGDDNWDTNGLYLYDKVYTKKPVRTSFFSVHGPQKTGPKWSGSVPPISGSVLDQLRLRLPHLEAKNRTGPDLKTLSSDEECNQGVDDNGEECDDGDM